MATLIEWNNTVKEVRPADGKSFTLEELQFFVGGYIQVLEVDDLIFVMNEEGKLQNLPLNRIATERARHVMFAEDFMVGNVLTCTRAEMEGEDEE